MSVNNTVPCPNELPADVDSIYKMIGDQIKNPTIEGCLVVVDCMERFYVNRKRKHEKLDSDFANLITNMRFELNLGKVINNYSLVAVQGAVKVYGISQSWSQ